jgi:hypothetical protein
VYSVRIGPPQPNNSLNRLPLRVSRKGFIVGVAHSCAQKFPIVLDWTKQFIELLDQSPIIVSNQVRVSHRGARGRTSQSLLP